MRRHEETFDNIRPCTVRDFDAMVEIINDSAKAYRGAIPADRYHEPYMPADELLSEMKAGVRFWGYEADGNLAAVMGLQDVGDVDLIRHAYVRSRLQNQGIGGKLLRYLLGLTEKPVLIGTWAGASWAVGFYEKHGFKRVSEEDKNRLLKKYWSIPERQIETSVVLADRKWLELQSDLEAPDFASL